MLEIGCIRLNNFIPLLTYFLTFSFSISMIAETFTTKNVSASTQTTIKCAIATGYPPYQFTENGVPVGIDVQLINLINKFSPDLKIEIYPMLWSDAMATLSFTDKLDCIFGMEINVSRSKRFLFTMPLYTRHSSLFVLADSHYKKLSDIYDLKISSDEDSLLHDELFHMKKFRLVKVNTKEEAFKKLVAKEISAAIFPEQIGLFFSKKSKVKLRILKKANTPTNVSIAIKSENLQTRLNRILSNIPKSEFQKILNNY